MTSIATSAPGAFGYGAGQGQRLWVTGDTLTFKATAAETGGSMTAIEVLAAPSCGPPPLGPAEIERSREAAIRYGMEVRWPESNDATQKSGGS